MGFAAATLIGLQSDMCRCKHHCGVFRQAKGYAKGSGRAAPTSPAAAIVEVVTETCTLISTCVQIPVYMLHVCIHGHAHSCQSTDCNPYRGFSVASQISWQPHGAAAVKRVVINKILIHRNRDRRVNVMIWQK